MKNTKSGHTTDPGSPGGLDGKESTCRVGAQGWEDPERSKWRPAPGFLPGESHGQSSLAGYSAGGRKSQTTERLTHNARHIRKEKQGKEKNANSCEKERKRNNDGIFQNPRKKDLIA